MHVISLSALQLCKKNDDDIDRGISCKSRILKAAERNYPVQDNELFRINYALVKFRVPIGHRTFYSLHG